MIEINRILCPIDFSDCSDHALEYAVKMASWYDASLHVLHVMPILPPSTVSPLGEAGRHLTLKNLSQAVNRWWRPDVTIEQELIESADAAGRILERAESLDVDLIVAGSHGRTGAARVMFGSVVEHLLHRSRRPVMAVPSHIKAARLDGPIAFARIVCAVDFAAPSLAALAHALSIAEEADGRLTMVNVIEVPPELTHSPLEPGFNVDQVRAAAEAGQLEKLRALVPEHARDYCTVETAVIEGGVSRQVLRVAAQKDADLIVIGVHGRNALDLAIFGSNSREILARAECPVLVVPAGRLQSMRAAS